MFVLRKTKSVEAAHNLPHHDGKCRGLHGHTWQITIEVEGEALNATGPKRGMLFDYYDMGQIMKDYVEILDHRYLNDIYENPTSEAIAKSLFLQIEPQVMIKSGGTARLARVLVSETASSCAEYRP